MELLVPLNDSSFAAKTVAYTGTAGTLSAWQSGPQGVLVWCTTDAYVRITNNLAVGASSIDTPLPAGTPVVFKVPNTGVPWTVSAVQIATAGTMYAKPINKE